MFQARAQEVADLKQLVEAGTQEKDRLTDQMNELSQKQAHNQPVSPAQPTESADAPTTPPAESDTADAPTTPAAVSPPSGSSSPQLPVDQRDAAPPTSAPPDSRSGNQFGRSSLSPRSLQRELMATRWLSHSI